MIHTESGGDTEWPLVAFWVVLPPHLKPAINILHLFSSVSPVASDFCQYERHLFQSEGRLVAKISHIHCSTDVIPTPGYIARNKYCDWHFEPVREPEDISASVGAELFNSSTLFCFLVE